MKSSSKEHSLEMHINSERGGDNAFIRNVIPPDLNKELVPTVIEVCPGVAVETVSGHVAGIRLYPVPRNANDLEYEPLNDEACHDIAAMTATLECLIKKLKLAA